MIFVTVGAHTPFDRLVRTVDAWAGESAGDDVFVQIGESTLRPRHVRWARFISPEEFARHVSGCRVMISHAGTGSILAALGAGVPLLVMPRRADLQETRNDHQLATASHLCPRLGVEVAADEDALRERLGRLDTLKPGRSVGPFADEALLGAIRGFVGNAT